MLDTELLTTFVAICETRGFTAAGNVVGRTQSAVSMQVKRLEAQLGCRLFHRSPHGLSLTPKGELLLTHARRILHAQREAMIAFDRNAVSGVVTLGIPNDYAYRLLPRVLAEFAELYPRATVDVLCEQSKDLVGRIRDGSLDLAFVTEGEGPGGGHIVHSEPCAWVTGVTGSAHCQTPLPLAAFHEGCTYRRWMLEALARAGRDYRIAFTSLSMTGIQSAVRAGLAVSVMATSSVLDGMRVLAAEEGFPPLPQLNVRLQRTRSKASPVLDHLEAFLGERLAQPFAAAAA